MSHKGSNPPPPAGVTKPAPPPSPPPKNVRGEAPQPMPKHPPDSNQAPAITDKARCFLRALATLCEDYQVDFYYTRDEDGLHISMDGNDIFVGHTDHGDTAETLRQALI